MTVEERAKQTVRRLQDQGVLSDDDNSRGLAEATIRSAIQLVLTDRKIDRLMVTHRPSPETPQPTPRPKPTPKRVHRLRGEVLERVMKMDAKELNDLLVWLDTPNEVPADVTFEIILEKPTAERTWNVKQLTPEQLVDLLNESRRYP